MIPPESYSARSVPASSQRKEGNEFMELEFKGRLKEGRGKEEKFHY
jgi:hypothetical protein